MNKNNVASEDKVRTTIREAIKLYAIHKRNLSEQRNLEEKLRNTIKKILIEKESKELPPSSTLEGIMRSLLNNVIPQIRIDYVKLQTNNEERDGFKDYFYNAVDKIIELAYEQRTGEPVDELEEAASLSIKSNNPDFISGVSDGTEEPSSTKKTGEVQDKKEVASYFQRGQNFGEDAFGAIRDRIEDVIHSKIVPDEYSQFVKLLKANLEAWFEIWDKNKSADQQAVPDSNPADQLSPENDTMANSTTEEPAMEPETPDMQDDELAEEIDYDFE